MDGSTPPNNPGKPSIDVNNEADVAAVVDGIAAATADQTSNLYFKHFENKPLDQILQPVKNFIRKNYDVSGLNKEGFRELTEQVLIKLIKEKEIFHLEGEGTQARMKPGPAPAKPKADVDEIARGIPADYFKEEVLLEPVINALKRSIARQYDVSAVDDLDGFVDAVITKLTGERKLFHVVDIDGQSYARPGPDPQDQGIGVTIRRSPAATSPAPAGPVQNGQLLALINDRPNVDGAIVQQTSQSETPVDPTPEGSDGYSINNSVFSQPANGDIAKSQTTFKRLDKRYNFSKPKSNTVLVQDKSDPDKSIELTRNDQDVDAKYTGDTAKFGAKEAMVLAISVMEAESRMDGEFVVDLKGTPEQLALIQAAFEELKSKYPQNEFKYSEGTQDAASLSQETKDNIAQAARELGKDPEKRPTPEQVARQQKITALKAKIADIEAPLQEAGFTQSVNELDQGLSDLSDNLVALEKRLSETDPSDTETLTEISKEYETLQEALGAAEKAYQEDINSVLGAYDQSIKALIGDPESTALLSPDYIQQVQAVADRVNGNWNGRVSGLTEAIDEKIKSIGATIEQGEYAALEKTYTEARKALDDSGALAKAAANLAEVQNIRTSVETQENRLNQLQAEGGMTLATLEEAKDTYTALGNRLEEILNADAQEVTPHLNRYKDVVDAIATREDEHTQRLIEAIGEDDFFAHRQPNAEWEAATEGLTERIDEGLAKIVVEETKITVQNALDSAIATQEKILADHLKSEFGTADSLKKHMGAKGRILSPEEKIDRCMDQVSDAAAQEVHLGISSVENDNAAHAALRLHFLSEFKEKGMTHTGGDVPDCEDKMIALADQKIQGIQDGAGLTKAEIWETLQASRQRQVAARKQTRAPATA
ncbi:MAG: hypothetical protein AAF569_02580 [Pseudomonadota bacterium]